MKVINPLTGKLINVNGVLHKQLIKKGLFNIKKQELNLLETILLNSTPSDLLSLYLTNKATKKILNTLSFLNLLNQQYHVESKTFLAFYKNVTIKNLTLQKHNNLYLYHLEYELFKPVHTSTDRITMLTQLYVIYKKLKLTPQVFGLAVALNDAYHQERKSVV